jgi:hypothetical protein
VERTPQSPDHKSLPQTSPGRDGRIQSPARECREKKPTETKSPLGDATTNLLVRLDRNPWDLPVLEITEVVKSGHPGRIEVVSFQTLLMLAQHPAKRAL